MTTTIESSTADELKRRAERLKLHGLLAHWDELSEPQLAWVQTLLRWEESERQQRGLQRRLSAAHIGRFKPLADFDWSWPEQCDKAAVSELMALGFINQAVNIVLVGPNGIGKSTIAQNIVHHAVMQGHSALFVNAAQMLGDLAAQDGDNALRRRLRHYAHPSLLVIDEIGYLSYANRHADLLFEIISRRYESKPTIVTTNRPFTE
jgi:DNA replication protein DnaC